MRSLKPMHRVGRPQLARLHNESQQAGSQRQEKERIAQPSSNPRTHRQDSNPESQLEGLREENVVRVVRLASATLFAQSPPDATG
jgi:hypothetical protein